MISDGDILEVSTRFTHQGSNRGMNVWHFLVTEMSMGTDQEFADAVTDDMAALHNLWLASFTPTSIRGTTAVFRKLITPGHTWLTVAESDFNVVGVSLGDVLPLGAPAKVKFPHQGGGRTGSKSVYGLSEGSTTQSAVTALVAAALAGWGADMAQEIGDTGAKMTPIILHSDFTHHLYTGSALVDAPVGYNRTRKQAVGW